MKHFVRLVNFLLRKSIEGRAGVTLKTYEQGGRTPWSNGYSKYRNALVTDVLQSADMLRVFFESLPLPDNFGFKVDERIVEIPWVASRIDPASSILDAGCAFFKYPAARKMLSDQSSIILMALDAKDMAFELKEKSVDRILADLRDIPIPAGSLENVVCISTLEHIGMDNTKLYTSIEQFRESKTNDYLKAVAEMARILKVNGNLFITVPYGKFHDHGWLQVFDSEMVEKVISKSGCTLVSETIYKHENSGWNISNRMASSDSVYFDVHSRSTDVSTSNLAAAEAVACLHLRRT